MKNVSCYQNVNPYITKDGSIIRELMHPANHAVINQSMAEAIVPVGQVTKAHKHIVTEEIYFIVEGEGQMTLADEQFNVYGADSICISPGTLHCIRNTGVIPLRILCCCSPAYSDEDTVLVD